ncbi:hypothetical protein K440DRAFT_661437 [Wilcoxina mikolae CBS 423.85]|nr:hypothetical protein K440DRAFT_661437 [Wilcoxina mikolae CBS 423.85]
MWFFRGIVGVAVLMLMSLREEVSVYALPQGDVLDGNSNNNHSNNNVFTYPMGGIVNPNEPVVISWIPSTPGPVTIKFTKGTTQRPIAISIQNTGSFIWTIPEDLIIDNDDDDDDDDKYNLSIVDETTKQTTNSQPFSIQPLSSLELRQDHPIVVVSVTTLPHSVTTVVASTKPPSITDTKLLLDHSVPPTGNPAAPAPPLVTTDSVVSSSPNVGIIAGITVGSFAAASLLLFGAFLLWKRKRRYDQMQKLEEESIREELKEIERKGAIETYGRTRGMVNAF